MSGEIKFRAWDKKQNKWVNPNRAFDMHIKADKTITILDITENTIYLQYTGLKDKNGVEIYEGDIIEFTDLGEGNHEEFCSCEHCFPYKVGKRVKIVRIEGQFCLLPVDYVITEGFCELCTAYIGLLSPNHEIHVGFYTKVVGNIYQNPELIRKKSY